LLGITVVREGGLLFFQLLQLAFVILYISLNLNIFEKINFKRMQGSLAIKRMTIMANINERHLNLVYEKNI
jgi:hypothetical protein